MRTRVMREFLPIVKLMMVMMTLTRMDTKVQITSLIGPSARNQTRATLEMQVTLGFIAPSVLWPAPTLWLVPTDRLRMDRGHTTVMLGWKKNVVLYSYCCNMYPGFYSLCLSSVWCSHHLYHRQLNLYQGMDVHYFGIPHNHSSRLSQSNAHINNIMAINQFLKTGDPIHEWGSRIDLGFPFLLSLKQHQQVQPSNFRLNVLLHWLRTKSNDNFFQIRKLLLADIFDLLWTRNDPRISVQNYQVLYWRWKHFHQSCPFLVSLSICGICLHHGWLDVTAQADFAYHSEASSTCWIAATQSYVPFATCQIIPRLF